MGDQEKKSSIQSLAAALFGFVVVVGLGGFLILRHGGASEESSGVSYAPVDADSGLRAPTRSAVPAATGAAASSPAPLLSEEAREESPAAAGVTAANRASAASGGSAAKADDPAAAGANSAAAGLAVGSNLDAGSSASSSASVAASSTSVAASPKSAAKKPFAAPKLDLSKNQGSVASTVHYGVSDRHELMGRAAGPVYNFAGKGAGQAQSGQVAAGSLGASGAIRQVDAAQKQFDASGARRRQSDGRPGLEPGARGGRFRGSVTAFAAS
jgi:hypothetical protein